jgi:hypothetical protein
MLLVTQGCLCLSNNTPGRHQAFCLTDICLHMCGETYLSDRSGVTSPRPGWMVAVPGRLPPAAAEAAGMCCMPRGLLLALPTTWLALPTAPAGGPAGLPAATRLPAPAAAPAGVAGSSRMLLMAAGASGGCWGSC